MASAAFDAFEQAVRSAHLVTDEDASTSPNSHPFEQRNLFERFPVVIRNLFDNGHYAQATFEALKFLDKEVSRLSSVSDSGKSLMMKVFSEASPRIRLNKLSTDSERNEQEGYKFLFAGSILAIRNPRGHEFNVQDSIDDCLDHLGFVSMLIRKLESAGFKMSS